MVLLPCSKCCGKCTCKGCLQLYASGSTAGQKDPCFAFNYEARELPFVGNYVGDLELDGEQYECAYVFRIFYDEISGADVQVGQAYLVLPKDVKPPNPSGPSQPPNGKALFFVRTSLGWTADYEIDNVKECPRYVAPGPPGATVDPNADEGYSITFTKADMVASTGNPDECGELTFTVTECHDPPPPRPLCCCDPFGVVLNPDDCGGETTEITFPRPTIDDISIVVEWGGLSVVLSAPFFSESALGGANFSCKTGDGDPFDARERTIQANGFVRNSGFGGEDGCWFVDLNVSVTFSGINPISGFFAISSNTVFTTVGECKLEDEVATTSPDFCPNPYGPVKVGMVIAP